MNLYVFYLFILGLSFYFCANAVVLIRIFLSVLLEVSTVSVSTQARISPRWSFSSITFLEIVVASSACFPTSLAGFSPTCFTLCSLDVLWGRSLCGGCRLCPVCWLGPLPLLGAHCLVALTEPFHLQTRMSWFFLSDLMALTYWRASSKVLSMSIK